ncbi:putative lysine decarboxylase [Blastochloris viridis]|nr:putative lysine decarboxylase [Blastochloris viridis]
MTDPVSASAGPDATPALQSPSYRLAALDRDFLLGDSMRGARFLLEYSKVEETLRRENIRSTVVVFGSARVRETGPGRHADWYAMARDFGRIASQRGGALDHGHGVRDNVITTGGGPGLMEAANRGAIDVGAPSIGFNILLPHEQMPNPYTTPLLTFRFHYFAMRKMHFAIRANALVAFPGGFGTLDEVFEILTLRQTGKMGPVPIVLVDRAFWTRLLDLPILVDNGLIDQDDVALIDYADSADEAWAVLARHGLGKHDPALPPQPLGAPAGRP